MALNPKPDPVLCADVWRHRGQSVGPPGGPPPATAFVRGSAALTAAWSPRCDPCVRTLAAASPDAAVVDVVDLGPARTTVRYDADTTSA